MFAFLRYLLRNSSSSALLYGKTSRNCLCIAWRQQHPVDRPALAKLKEPATRAEPFEASSRQPSCPSGCPSRLHQSPTRCSDARFLSGIWLLVGWTGTFLEHGSRARRCRARMACLKVGIAESILQRLGISTHREDRLSPRVSPWSNRWPARALSSIALFPRSWSERNFWLSFNTSIAAIISRIFQTLLFLDPLGPARRSISSEWAMEKPREKVCVGEFQPNSIFQNKRRNPGKFGLASSFRAGDLVSSVEVSPQHFCELSLDAWNCHVSHRDWNLWKVISFKMKFFFGNRIDAKAKGVREWRWLRFGDEFSDAKKWTFVQFWWIWCFEGNCNFSRH